MRSVQRKPACLPVFRLRGVERAKVSIRPVVAATQHEVSREGVDGGVCILGQLKIADAIGRLYGRPRISRTFAAIRLPATIAVARLVRTCRVMFGNRAVRPLNR